MKEAMTFVRIACLTLVSVLIASCGTVGGSMRDLDTPGVDEFANREITFVVAGSQEAVRDRLVAHLSRRSLFHRVEIRAPQTFVVTVFLDEPSKPDDRRVRRTSYRFAVGAPAGDTPCVPVAVTWLAKSRGLREETWSIQSADVSFVPGSWGETSALLERERCRS